MESKSYQKLRLNEFNVFDTERTLRENIYDLEQENMRIEALVSEMVTQRIPVPIIIGWMRQMEDNAGEIVYLNSLVQHDLRNYDFSASTLFKRGES